MCNRAGVLKEEGSAENNLYKELHIYQILRGHKGEKYTLLPNVLLVYVYCMSLSGLL